MITIDAGIHLGLFLCYLNTSSSSGSLAFRWTLWQQVRQQKAEQSLSTLLQSKEMCHRLNRLIKPKCPSLIPTLNSLRACDFLSRRSAHGQLSSIHVWLSNLWHFQSLSRLWRHIRVFRALFNRVTWELFYLRQKRGRKIGSIHRDITRAPFCKKKGKSSLSALYCMYWRCLMS